MSMVLSERRGSITILTLNNPEQYNALGGSLLNDLDAALDDGSSGTPCPGHCDDRRGQGFLLRGAVWRRTHSPPATASPRVCEARINPLVEKMRSLSIPIVVAVNGAAAGAGVGIALAGDIVIAARSARFILSFVRLGAALDGGTSLFLQRSIGVARARALALLGEPLAAETAEQWGLIWKVVEDGDLLDEAMAVAQKLADGPPISLGLIKSQIESGVEFIIGIDARRRSLATSSCLRHRGSA